MTTAAPPRPTPAATASATATIHLLTYLLTSASVFVVTRKRFLFAQCSVTCTQCVGMVWYGILEFNVPLDTV